MADVRSAADSALFWKTVHDAVTRIYNQARDAAELEMNKAASERQRVLSREGIDYGSVSLGTGKYVVEVVDNAALYAWVEDNCPDELWTPPVQLRNLALDRLMQRTLAGEEIPGLRRVWRDGSLTVRPTPAAREVTRAMLQTMTEGTVGAVPAPTRELPAELPGDRAGDPGALAKPGYPTIAGDRPTVLHDNSGVVRVVEDGPDVSEYDGTSGQDRRSYSDEQDRESYTPGTEDLAF